MLAERLRLVVEQELGQWPAADALVEEFLRRSVWSRALGEALLDAGRNGAWEHRLAAALMLENLALRFADGEAFVREVLPAGDDLRVRLRRLRHVHARIDGGRTTPAALRAFFRVTATPCRIALSRYLVTPAEVVERVLSMLDTATGLRDVLPGQNAHLSDETDIALRGVPAYEREIGYRLRDLSRTFWVCDRTPSHLHALVEYPIGTVVAVVKPPGSDYEIELKRAGLRGPKPIDVFFARGANILPPSHHLRGGSSGHLLHWERGAGNLLSRVYRLVHGENAALSYTLGMTVMMNVPLGGGEVNIIRYFNERELYPGDYDVMRRHMLGSIRHLEQMRADPVYPNAVAMTGGFIGASNPTQAVQLGNSSFRIDRVALYLSRRGPHAYFTRGLDRPYRRADEYALADELFEEVLPGFEPVARRGSYQTYVSRTLRHNQALADRYYLAALEQLGTMWGTVAGARAGSEGESFVPRNIGLRAELIDGAWRVRIRFMDHDALNFNGKHDDDLHPAYRGRAMANDFRHLFGSRANYHRVVGTAPTLERIYRPKRDVQRKGYRVIRRAACAAYIKTTEAFKKNRELRQLFFPKFVRRFDDWDIVVNRFVRQRGNVEGWRRWATGYLRKRRYRKELIREFVRFIPKSGYIWRRAAFIYKRVGTSG